MRGAKDFTGKLLVAWIRFDNKGRFQEMDVRVDKSEDIIIQGKMTYRNILIKEQNGQYRYDPEHAETSN